MTCFETLFSSFTIGNLRLKNRILMAAMGNNFSHPDGTVSDRAIAYYTARAHGGAGLIITETSSVSLSGRHRTRGICAYGDSFASGDFSSRRNSPASRMLCWEMKKNTGWIRWRKSKRF